MKAIGNYIIVQQYEERVNDILVKENNVGIVVDGANEHGSLVGKKVIFSTMKPIEEYGEYKFIHKDYVLAVIE